MAAYSCGFLRYCFNDNKLHAGSLIMNLNHSLESPFTSYVISIDVCIAMEKVGKEENNSC